MTSIGLWPCFVARIARRLQALIAKWGGGNKNERNNTQQRNNFLSQPSPDSVGTKYELYDRSQ
jgi:hypothetical protein